MKSLRARVTVAATAASAVILAICGSVVVSHIGDRYLADLDRRLEHMHERAIQDAFRTSVLGYSPNTVDTGEAMGHAFIYSGRTGEIVKGSGHAEGLPRAPQGFSFQFEGDRRWRVYMAPSNVAGRGWGTPDVQVGLSTEEVDAEIARARNIALGAGAGATLIIGLLSLWLASVALAPLARTRERTRQLTHAADPSARLPVEGPPEVAGLTGSVNRLLDRLQLSVARAEAALEATRTFTADAGHELRTPLTSLRANLDVLGRDGLSTEDRARALRDCLGAHQRLTALIDALQTLARGDAAVGRHVERLDLAELADAAVMDARRRHPGTAFELAGAEAAVVEGDADGLRTLLDNLVENAARHGGSRVRVHLKRGPGFARVSVDDDGPGIPDEEKRRVFERFARGSGARNGTGSGLGLAIAAQQARLHGGRIELADSPLGGARFELVLSAPSSS